MLDIKDNPCPRYQTHDTSASHSLSFSTSATASQNLIAPHALTSPQDIARKAHSNGAVQHKPHPHACSTVFYIESKNSKHKPQNTPRKAQIKSSVNSTNSKPKQPTKK